MAIQTEHFDVNGRDFICTFSDSNKYVVRDGIITIWRWKKESIIFKMM